MDFFELKNVNLFIDNKLLLDNINLSIKEGERIIIFGKNGSGKSLLLKILTGYMHPSSGLILRFGEEFIDIRDMHKYIGYISTYIKQNMHRNENILEAVISGKFGTIGIYDKYDKTDKEYALEMMKLCGIEYLKDRRYENLSDGEKERVLIARALMAKPKSLILDEPCNHLDIKGREEMITTIADIAEHDKNLTIIYITHHIEEISHIYQRMLILKKGRITGEGTIKEMLVPETISQALDFEIDFIEKGKRLYTIPR